MLQLLVLKQLSIAGGPASRRWAAPSESSSTTSAAMLQQEIMRDPVVDDLTMLSVITFADTASTVVPLSFPTEIQRPTLESGGLTNYGPAFREFHRAFQADRARLKATASAPTRT